MGDSMVTGRMDEQKKLDGNRILKRAGLNASQAINLMYDRVLADGNADFLVIGETQLAPGPWGDAADFVDSLSKEHSSRFDGMTKAQIRSDRLRNRGLM